MGAMQAGSWRVYTLAMPCSVTAIFFFRRSDRLPYNPRGGHTEGSEERGVRGEGGAELSMPMEGEVRQARGEKGCRGELWVM